MGVPRQIVDDGTRVRDMPNPGTEYSGKQAEETPIMHAEPGDMYGRNELEVYGPSFKCDLIRTFSKLHELVNLLPLEMPAATFHDERECIESYKKNSYNLAK